jgi:hypothetical protein
MKIKMKYDSLELKAGDVVEAKNDAEYRSLTGRGGQILEKEENKPEPKKEPKKESKKEPKKEEKKSSKKEEKKVESKEHKTLDKE